MVDLFDDHLSFAIFALGATVDGEQLPESVLLLLITLDFVDFLSITTAGLVLFPSFFLVGATAGTGCALSSAIALRWLLLLLLLLL